MGRKGKLYTPASLLCVVLPILVAVFVAVILTPGIAAPEGSVTLPVIAPVVVCPIEIGPSAVSAKQIANRCVFDIKYPFVTNLKQDTRNRLRAQDAMWGRLWGGAFSLRAGLSPGPTPGRSP